MDCSISKIRKFKELYPNRIPIIVKDNDTLLSKTKYLVPRNYTIAQFIVSMKRYLKENCNENQTLLLFFNQTLERPDTSMIENYNKHRYKDLITVNLVKENTFG